MRFKESRPKVNEQTRVLSAQSDAPEFNRGWNGWGFCTEVSYVRM